MQRECKNEEPIRPPMRDNDNNFQEDSYEVDYPRDPEKHKLDTR